MIKNKFLLYNVLVFLLFVLGFSLIISINVYVDPFWVWHKTPIWKTNSNPFLKDHVRYFKALQVVEQQPKILLVGSSRVYFGINPDTIKTDKKIYNMGISELNVNEAYSYINYALRWTPAKTIVYGLDYFDFFVPDKKTYADSKRNEYYSLYSNIMMNFLGETALVASFTNYILAKFPFLYYSVDNWHRNGFVSTSIKPKKTIDHDLNLLVDVLSQERLLVDNYSYLQKTIDLTEQHGVTLLLYISPVNYRRLDAIKKEGGWNEYLAWKDQIAKISQKNGITLWDFGTYNSVTTVPFKTEEEMKKNPYALDALHFSPLVGQFIMRRLGFDTVVTNVPKDFGKQI
jgi:hypothetical protein